MKITSYSKIGKVAIILVGINIIFSGLTTAYDSVNFPANPGFFTTIFEKLYVVKDSNNFVNLNENGQIDQKFLATSGININGSNFTEPSLAMIINSLSGGLFSEGVRFGILSIADSDNAFNARIGVEGIVTARESNGSEPRTVRGYAGFLKGNATSNYELFQNFVQSNPNAENRQYVRMDFGTPYAFYTDDDAKFQERVLVSGNITTPESFTSERITINDSLNNMTSSSSLNNTEVSGELEVANPRVTRVSGSKPFNHKDNSAEQIFTKDASCPENSIRLGCAGGIESTTTPLYSPYMGTVMVGERNCRSYARRPTGTVSGDLLVYAFCLENN